MLAEGFEGRRHIDVGQGDGLNDAKDVLERYGAGGRVNPGAGAADRAAGEHEPDFPANELSGQRVTHGHVGRGTGRLTETEDVFGAEVDAVGHGFTPAWHASRAVHSASRPRALL